MKTKNFLMATAIILGASLTFTSCSKDDDDDPVAPPVAPVADYPTITVSGNISTNTTWTKDNIVILDGRVIVESGAELTIQAGTVIKGEDGQDANASVLIIAPGAKIHATGTASEPIIFTSVLDQIEPGTIVSPNLSATQNGYWGGVIILGNAEISAGTGGALADIEGIPAGTASYGGSNNADNSGEFQYCSIRHGGIVIGNNNEINGLTLGGVGNGTTIDHIEVVGNLDDGIECFGGAVNITDAVVIYQGDDAYDVDQSYSGTISNFAAVIGANTEGDAFEIDGPENVSINGGGLFTFDKGYIIGNASNTDADYAVFKSKAQGTLQNVYFTGFNAAAKVDVLGNDAYNNYVNVSPSLIINNNVFNVSSLTGLFDSDVADPSAGTTKFESGVENTTGATLTNGFDATQFNTWTWAAAYGMLN